MNHRWIKPLVAAAMLFAVFSSLAAAETGRTLGGYRFVPVSKVEEPFITTRFSNFTGLAWATGIEFPLLVIDTEPPDTLLALSGNFVFVVADFEYQHVVHPRVSIKISGGGASRVGTSATALLSQGVTVLMNARLGTMVELWRNDRVLLSAAAGLGYADGMIIDFVQFAEDVADGNYEDASIIRDASGVSVDGALRSAWALNPWAGIVALGMIGYSEVEGIDNEFRWRVAASGTVDFGQRGNAPVGLSLSLDVDRLRPNTLQAEPDFGLGFGIHYTGRDDFNLGLELSTSRMPLSGWDEVAYPTSLGAALNYYF